MARNPRAGLLLHYVKLYDDVRPGARDAFAPFIDEIAKGLEEQGIEVVTGPICRLRAEFEDTLRRFEEADVDAVVSAHLAYSPSLESIDALCATSKPLVLLDTTMDYEFGPATVPERIMFNHGVHGVQDLACMLRRRERPYAIVAGHVSRSPVLRRAADLARGALAARALRGLRALRVGESFRGMGDFAVTAERLEASLGVKSDEVTAEALAGAVAGVTDEDVERERALDHERFDVLASDETHRRSLRVGLGLRRLLDEGGYGALSVNFLAFERDDGPVDTVPFLEISKAMGRGVGYAGEGDLVAASLVGALGTGFGRTTFTEVFCPDWSGGSLFLSHMGEINPEVSAERPVLREKEFPWTGARNPAVLTCAPAPGPAVLVNLAPGPGDTFTLIAAPVQVLGDALDEGMREAVRGWIRPECPLERFLEEYSRRGGTHHSALVLGARIEGVEAFGAFAGIETTVIGKD